jgi:hypothetical protein
VPRLGDRVVDGVLPKPPVTSPTAPEPDLHQQTMLGVRPGDALVADDEALAPDERTMFGIHVMDMELLAEPIGPVREPESAIEEGADPSCIVGQQLDDTTSSEPVLTRFSLPSPIELPIVEEPVPGVSTEGDEGALIGATSPFDTVVGLSARHVVPDSRFAEAPPLLPTGGWLDEVSSYLKETSGPFASAVEAERVSRSADIAPRLSDDDPVDPSKSTPAREDLAEEMARRLSVPSREPSGDQDALINGYDGASTVLVPHERGDVSAIAESPESARATQASRAPAVSTLTDLVRDIIAPKAGLASTSGSDAPRDDADRDDGRDDSAAGNGDQRFGTLSESPLAAAARSPSEPTAPQIMESAAAGRGDLSVDSVFSSSAPNESTEESADVSADGREQPPSWGVLRGYGSRGVNRIRQTATADAYAKRKRRPSAETPALRVDERELELLDENDESAACDQETFPAIMTDRLIRPSRDSAKASDIRGGEASATIALHPSADERRVGEAPSTATIEQSADDVTQLKAAAMPGVSATTNTDALDDAMANWGDEETSARKTIPSNAVGVAQAHPAFAETVASKSIEVRKQRSFLAWAAMGALVGLAVALIGWMLLLSL